MKAGRVEEQRSYESPDLVKGGMLVKPPDDFYYEIYLELLEH